MRQRPRRVAGRDAGRVRDPLERLEGQTGEGTRVDGLAAGPRRQGQVRQARTGRERRQIRRPARRPVAAAVAVANLLDGQVLQITTSSQRPQLERAAGPDADALQRQAPELRAAADLLEVLGVDGRQVQRAEARQVRRDGRRQRRRRLVQADVQQRADARLRRREHEAVGRRGVDRAVGGAEAHQGLLQLGQGPRPRPEVERRARRRHESS